MNNLAKLCGIAGFSFITSCSYTPRENQTLYREITDLEIIDIISSEEPVFTGNCIIEPLSENNQGAIIQFYDGSFVTHEDINGDHISDYIGSGVYKTNGELYYYGTSEVREGTGLDIEYLLEGNYGCFPPK